MSEDAKYLTLGEVLEKYKGRWVAARVVERDEAGQPAKLDIVAVGDRYRVREYVEAEDDVCIFYAGDVPMEGWEAIV